MGASFEAVWGKVVRTFRPAFRVENWSQARGYTGGNFRIEHVGNSGIMVFGGNMSVPRAVSRGEFEKVYAVWDEYTGGEYSRAELTKLSQNTTYILSILHSVLAADT